MKAKIIYFYLAMLPLIIHGASHLEPLKQQLENMAKTKRIINGIFKPAVGGYLGYGAWSIIFKGKLLKPIERVVAMKCTHVTEGELAEREFEAYTYLDAINNTDVEYFGIPAVYYYGKWDDFILMAITLLDSEYEKSVNKRTLQDVDILIILREFVRISKYIHSRGVHHSDMKLSNIMFRRQKAFIIDFNFATKLYRTNSSRKFGIPPKNVYEDRRLFAAKDWSRFLKEVRRYTGVNLEGFKRLALCISRNEDPNQCTDLNKHPFENNRFARKEFREVFVEFLYYKFKLADRYKDASRFKLYDDLYQFISTKIDEFKLPQPVLVSWLSDKDRRMAKKELKSEQLPDISSIEDRFANVHTEYPEVNFNYFSEMNEENTITSANTTGKNKKSFLSRHIVLSMTNRICAASNIQHRNNAKLLQT